MLTVLAGEFLTYLHYCRQLQFEDRPDYAYLRQLFRNLSVREAFVNDFVFDWTVQIQEQRSRESGRPEDSVWLVCVLVCMSMHDELLESTSFQKCRKKIGTHQALMSPLDPVSHSLPAGLTRAGHAPRSPPS